MQDILYDPQTSGGLLIALPKEEAAPCLRELQAQIPEASVIGSVKEYGENWIVLN